MQHDNASNDAIGGPNEKILEDEQHEQTGTQPVKLLTVASEQDPERAPDLQVRAIIVTLAAGLYWIGLLYKLTILAAFSRNITPVLGGADKTSWIFNSFNVVTIVLAPIFSFLSDIYGRKYFIVIPLVFGLVGAVVGATAKSTPVTMIATALLGVSGSSQGVILAIPSEILPRRYRSSGAAVVFAMSALAPFPALLGISHSIRADPVNGWRWMFRSLIITQGVLAILWQFAYRPPPRDTDISRARPSIDWIGYGLLAGGTVPFLMALTWGGTTHPWNSGHVLGTLLAGIAGYVAFGVWEWKGRKDGILHHDLFQRRNYAFVILAIAIEGFVYLGFTSSYPAHVATVYEHDIFKAAMLALPFYGAFICAIPVGAIYAAKTRDNVTPIIVGYVLLTGAIIGFACSTPNTKGLFVAMDALAGLGFSMPLIFLTVVSQFAAPAALIGTSTAVVLSVRALGGSIGIAVTHTIFDTKIATKLPSYIAKATLPLGLNPAQLGPVIGAATGNEALIGAILAGRIPGITPQILGAASAAAAQAFSDSWRVAWIVLAPFSVVATLSIFLLKRNREEINYIVEAPLENIHHRNESQA